MAGSIIASPAPYHILAYGTLVGTSFFHTFVNSPILFKNTERPVFSAIQAKAFPVYFGLQTALPAILALTFPGNALLATPGGVSALLAESNRWGSLVPIVAMFVSGALNLFVLLPASREVMKQRQGQAKRDGKQWHEEGPHSEEMKALSKRFGMLHGISSLLNLATFIGAVTYSFTLGARL
ncbi:hypothetical protein ISF_00851 [Cordyceps fumosorosea ARSEF 2679]|uniref:TMEM205-like domain-containing protein n=1 Tax=Cordyceps fumosorosea (strain ARSEF 2679) TaxID=1081104 RepID=A0A168ELH5_CORFA|nr:hypothetical protein ISF_00851 [Cordyceps fumosorosea ARSEF 2679]OAA73950.1 hypothetical protein ISF_00851 [Cordyceps fumosorosea ARSEF 2679]